MWPQQVMAKVAVQYVQQPPQQATPALRQPVRRLTLGGPVLQAQTMPGSTIQKIPVETSSQQQLQCGVWQTSRPQRRSVTIACSSQLLRPPTLPVARGDSLDTSRSADSSPDMQQPSPLSPARREEDGIDRPWGTVERTFQAFCGTKPDMDGKTFAKLCKDSGLIDKALTATDVDIIFAKVVQKGQRRIGLDQFDAALELLAEKKRASIDDIYDTVRCCGGPVHKSTKADMVRFHDDKSLYTGTHAKGGPDSGRKGKGSISASTLPDRWRDEDSTPKDFFSTTQPNCEYPDTSTTENRTPNVSEKKVTHQTRGKMEDTFKVYCSGKPDMDGTGFVKLCKDCNLFDSILTTIDADLIFAQVLPRGRRRIGIQHFEDALKLVADKKGVDENQVCRQVAASDGMVHRCTIPDAVRFHDDRSTYTGTHVYGGPETSSKTVSADQFWSSTLRPSTDADNTLPDMVWQKLEAPQSQPARSAIRASESQVRRRATRERLSITAKKKPPAGDSDDFTMVFTDVQGSTSLWEACPRAMEQALRLHDAIIRQVLAKHSGYEVTTEGDAFQIAFHDAADAVAFCLDTQTELLRCEWPEKTLTHPDAVASSDGSWRGLRVRMGVHSGRPTTVTKHEVTGRWRYAGPAVAMAKAVEGVSHGGQIVISASSFYNIDGLLTQLGSPQVVDLGEHLVEGHGLGGESSPGGTENAAVQLLQLVPDALAHNYAEDPAERCGRTFPPILSERKIRPGFDDAPVGNSITLCFVFTQAARDLVTTSPGLASEALGLLRRCLREVLRHAGDGSGYECQEDEGAFMLAFANASDAAAFAVDLQQKLPSLPWPAELKQGIRGQEFPQGLRVSIGALSSSYTSRRPHASTGRADYFGTIVNRTARIAAAAHPGQVLLGGESPLPMLPQVAGYPAHAQLPQSQPRLSLGSGLLLNQTSGAVQMPAMTHSQAPACWSLQRLGSFALKGIDSPIALHELRILDSQGNAQCFPPPKTKGHVGP